MRRTHDKVERFASPAAFERVQRSRGSRAQFGLAAAAFRHNECHFVLTELSLDSLCHCKLGVIEGIPGFFVDIIVDLQYFFRKRLRRWIELGNELAADTVSHSNAKGIQITGHAVYLRETVCRIRDSTRNGDTPIFEALFQNVRYVSILWQQRQRPCFHPLSEGKHFHLPQIAAGNERIQHIVLKLRDQRCGGFPVHLSKQTRTVSGRAKDIAFAWVFGGVLIAVVGSILLRLAVVVGHQGRNGIYPIMGQQPSVAFGSTIQI